MSAAIRTLSALALSLCTLQVPTAFAQDDPSDDPTEDSAEETGEEPADTTAADASDQEDGPPLVPAEGANYVAVVIGLSSYQDLPDAVELDFARSDAAVVHKQLKAKANYTHTFLVTDGEATKENVRELLRQDVAQLVGPDDVFLLYIVGHGVGADLDEPVLLTYDSSLADAASSGFELNEFVADLSTWAQAGTMLVVTDVIHRNQLDGVYFFGPAANQWPDFSVNAAVISSSQADSPATDGAFGTVFADAVAGAADANKDGHVTLGELEDYLVNRVAPSGQIPVRAPESIPRETVIASGVRNEGATDPSATSAPIPDAVAQFPDTEVWSAKFVFREGASQSVRCRNQEVKACAPSCYVRNFKAGICDLKAVVDGVELSGKVPVVYPGRYSCGLRAGALSCRPPLEPAEERDD